MVNNTTIERSVNIEAVNIERLKILSPIIASIPHGSSCITSEMENIMIQNVLLTNNDWFLNELYDFLNKLNITRVSANYSRYVVDVNRNINKKHIEGDYTESLVYHKTTFGKNIYKNSLPSKVVENRIKEFYEPYHTCLLNEINSSLKQWNKVYLFDLHSFYAQSTADIVLGTCGRSTCSHEFLYSVYKSFSEEGFTVKIDEKGLKGGYIVSHYSSIENVEAIQIEIRYTTYIEDRYFGEEVVYYKDDILFNKTKERLTRVFKNIVRIVED
ncbi:N-formylglutamate amidohydrolase [Tissierella praeacuta]|uniref:N-formylglutamate amidohydrolase n=1 Tax=Tissierella praeacuta TaxID=43131 RepID=UPI001C11D2FE|nr:N-formylglutamate amidohydrolase [Tissierella praeacuta]MBU5257475.1 N-formylglutamate amidohydrolase [Tissierella praeacuta]